VYFVSNFTDDDPLKAIRYFHPSWVSEQQKLALCGQIMSLMNFCTDFEQVNFISLANGKFKVERCGRFIIAMGTDRNVQESILSQRSALMINILKLYHNDVNRVFEMFDEQSKNFSDKLYHIFETYLPVVQHNSNILQNVYKLHLPKSANSIFLEAAQVLETIANKTDVLGAMILYNNKVVGTQFSMDLTKVLVATDPIRIKTTAETAKNVNFHIPVGSQIVKIFISSNEYNRLTKHSKKVSDATSLGIQNTFPLPFSIKKKSKEPSMKRDKSLIFTHIPEEDVLMEIPSPMEKARSRPSHLPLKLKTIAPESGIASIVSFDETDSYPDFIGKTSVCCTPMTENKILTGPILSIFATSSNDVKINNPRENLAEMKSMSAIKEEEKPTTAKKVETKKWENVCIAYESNPFRNTNWKKKSWDDLLNDDDSNDNFCKNYNVYNTISDATFPIFDSKKQPMSKSIFDEFEALFSPPKPTQQRLDSAKVKESSSDKQILDMKKRFDADPMIMKMPENRNSPSRVLRNQKKKMLKLPIKSFSLDIGSSSSSSAAPSTSSAANTNKNTNTSIFDSPSTKTKKYMNGLQLTPLMSKLTILAMSENENFSSGFSSFDMPTPNYYDTPIDNVNRSLFNRLSKVDEEKHESTHDDDRDDDVHFNSEMKRVDLLVCGQQNMALLVIAHENSCDHQMVQQMFEISLNRLNRLEQKLNDVMNVTVDLKASDYSFMTFDKQWNVMQRSGAYDAASTLLMHDIFAKNDKTSDIILKTNESIVYGHNSGDKEIFYQHATKQSGSLIPSEFTIISQAKRKLERDQSVVLF
jgi:hypothetical protein